MRKTTYQALLTVFGFSICPRALNLYLSVLKPSPLGYCPCVSGFSGNNSIVAMVAMVQLFYTIFSSIETVWLLLSFSLGLCQFLTKFE